jgi:DNA-binding GntR family transcriptional regulator
MSVVPSGFASPARTTQSWVADELRERIIMGTIPVGARLRQVDIATEFKVSTTPVREAFRTLATEGLVQIDEHRGVVVRRLSLEECIELQELIIVVECDNLLHSIPKMDEQALSEAESIHRKMMRLGKRYPLLNRDLHLTLARPSGRQRSIALLDEMLTLSALHVHENSRRIVGRREQSNHEHQALVAAARARDAEGAAEIVRQHCQPMLSLLKQDLAGPGQARPVGSGTVPAR